MIERVRKTLSWKEKRTKKNVFVVIKNVSPKDMISKKTSCCERFLFKICLAVTEMIFIFCEKREFIKKMVIFAFDFDSTYLCLQIFLLGVTNPVLFSKFSVNLQKVRKN